MEIENRLKEDFRSIENRLEQIDIYLTQLKSIKEINYSLLNSKISGYCSSLSGKEFTQYMNKMINKTRETSLSSLEQKRNKCIKDINKLTKSNRHEPELIVNNYKLFLNIQFREIGKQTTDYHGHKQQLDCEIINQLESFLNYQNDYEIYHKLKYFRLLRPFNINLKTINDKADSCIYNLQPLTKNRLFFHNAYNNSIYILRNNQKIIRKLNLNSVSPMKNRTDSQVKKNFKSTFYNLFYICEPYIIRVLVNKTDRIYKLSIYDMNLEKVASKSFDQLIYMQYVSNNRIVLWQAKQNIFSKYDFSLRHLDSIKATTVDQRQIERVIYYSSNTFVYKLNNQLEIMNLQDKQVTSSFSNIDQAQVDSQGNLYLLTDKNNAKAVYLYRLNNHKENKAKLILEDVKFVNSFQINESLLYFLNTPIDDRLTII